MIIAEGPSGLKQVLEDLHAKSSADPSFAAQEHFLLYQLGNQKSLIKVDAEQMPFEIWHYDLLGRPATPPVRETIKQFLSDKYNLSEWSSDYDLTSKAITAANYGSDVNAQVRLPSIHATDELRFKDAATRINHEQAKHKSAYARAASVQNALKQNLPLPSQQDSTAAKYASLHRRLSVHADIEAKNQREIAAQQQVQPAARKRNP